MPIVKKPNGYYWGNRGPFATKSKALAVARAAYAGGYREETHDNPNHLQANTRPDSLRQKQPHSQ